MYNMRNISDKLTNNALNVSIILIIRRGYWPRKNWFNVEWIEETMDYG